MARQSKSKVIRKKKKVPQKTRMSWTWKRWVFVLSVIVFVGIVGYVLFYSPLAQVHEFEVNGTNRTNSDDIVQMSKDMLSGDFMVGVARDNYFFVNGNNIVTNILIDQRIKSAVVTKEFPHKIIIDVMEHDVVPIWCIGSMSGKCFTLESGHIKNEIDINSEMIVQNKHFFIVDESNEDVTIGDRVITSDDLEKVEILGEELIYTLSVGIEQPYLATSRGSHEVRFMTDENWYIIVDLTHDTDEIIDVAQLFMKKTQLPSRRIDLEYIDMRFPEKIFYKMKDGVEQSEEEIQELNDEKIKGKDESEDKKEDE